jgi:hypothetical protein
MLKHVHALPTHLAKLSQTELMAAVASLSACVLQHSEITIAAEGDCLPLKTQRNVMNNIRRKYRWIQQEPQQAVSSVVPGNHAHGFIQDVQTAQGLQTQTDELAECRFVSGCPPTPPLQPEPDDLELLFNSTKYTGNRPSSQRPWCGRHLDMQEDCEDCQVSYALTASMADAGIRVPARPDPIQVQVSTIGRSYTIRVLPTVSVRDLKAELAIRGKFNLQHINLYVGSRPLGDDELVQSLRPQDISAVVISSYAAISSGRIS